MRTYQTLLARVAQAEAKAKAKLDAMRAEAERLRIAERDGVIDRIREAIEVYSITNDELFGPRARKTVTTKHTPRAKIARPAMYRNPETGEEWSGTGGWPTWVRKLVRSRQGTGSMTWDDFVKQYAVKKPDQQALDAKQLSKEERDRLRHQRIRAARRAAKAKEAGDNDPIVYGAVYVDPESGEKWRGSLKEMPTWMKDRLLEGKTLAELQEKRA